MNLKTEFTLDECNLFRSRCNFTESEMEIFNLRVRECSIIEISMHTNLSTATVSRKLANIKRKICKVLMQN